MNKIDELRQHDGLYYNEIPIISDAEYDRLREIAQAEYPNDKYFNTIGAAVTLKDAKRHVYLIQSLDKITFEKSKDLFILGENRNLAIVSNKFDGITLEATYKDKRLISLVTRGDGMYGQDVSKHITELSQRIQYNRNLKDGIMIARFEAIISKSDFNSHFIEEYENARNCLPGLFSSDDENFLLNYVEFRLIDILYLKDKEGNDLVENDYKKYQLMKDNIESEFKLMTYDEFTKYYNDFIKNRKNYGYEVDGVVISNGGETDYTRSRPSHKKAVKFPIQTVEAIIDKFTYEVGKSGRITPICHIIPVMFMGTKISKMSLSNMSDIASKYGSLHVGDKLNITKGGDVIPRVENLISSNVDGELCVMPKFINNEEVQRDGIFYFVSKPLNKAIVKWIKAHNIDKISEGNVNKILEIYPKVTSILDFLKLKDISIYDNANSKMNIHINESIRKLKTTTLYNILIALQLKNFGKRLVQTWINSIPFTTDVLELIKTNPFNKDLKTYHILNAELIERHDEIQALFDFCDVVQSEIKKEVITMSSKGKVCVTGTFSVPRSEVQKKIILLGYEFVDRMTKDVKYLFTGEKVGANKLDKATKLGIAIYSEYDMDQILL